MSTAEEYRKETYRLLMRYKSYPQNGFRPRDIRERVEQLLEIERKYLLEKKLKLGSRK